MKFDTIPGHIKVQIAECLKDKNIPVSQYRQLKNRIENRMNAAALQVLNEFEEEYEKNNPGRVTAQ